MSSGTDGIRRLRVRLHGAVQGVGFRPFVFRLARELGLRGWVNNSPQGVLIEAEGPPPSLESFRRRLLSEPPPGSFILGSESLSLDPAGYEVFEIRKSDPSGKKSALILPDLAACPDCVRELFDPADRRHRYPFINCTRCGPRFSIISALPYDRANTSMRGFAMCPACRKEYDDPADRRFHAQPNACPDCGPRLEFLDAGGRSLALRGRALELAGEAVRSGLVVAVKGLGGFHLVADARGGEALGRLRERKRREEKPFALMFPSLESLRGCVELSDEEERLLASPQAPIVIAPRKPSSCVSPAAAPGNPCLGVLLPYTPLHHLLLSDLGFPVAATSGNRSEEPICIDEREAVARLSGIADAFLVHDRPILRHADDSIVRWMAGRELVLRRARGYAPLPVRVRRELEPVLAAGAQLKSAVALCMGRDVFISQHLGDLETEQAEAAFRRAAVELPALYDLRPSAAACDLHPDYLSTRWALESGLPLARVQHHEAHVLSCMAENDLDPPALGVAWDGAGLGADGAIWGGEFFLVDPGGLRRAAHLRTFPLPGGDKAAREGRRSAVGLLFEAFGPGLSRMGPLPPLLEFPAGDLGVLEAMCRSGANAPRTSSAGRLFDAAASLLGLRQRSSYEGQAAMELEYAAAPFDTREGYPMPLGGPSGEGPRVLDWGPLLESLLEDARRGVPAGLISARFHNSLAEAIAETALRLGRERVALSGGCFQNRRLSEGVIARLRSKGLSPYWHQRVPPNDGGIALGQAMAAQRLP